MGLTPYRKLQGREHGGAIAELGRNSSVSRARPEPEVSQEMGEGYLDGQDVVDRRAHLGNAVRKALARTVTRRPEHKRWSKAFFARVVCTPLEPKLSLLPAVQAQRQVYLTRGIVDRFRPTAGCKACAGRGGAHTHECRTRLKKCLTREA